MVDRQDIDALLIGSLYGELSSAEEARLAAHLESHPTDRTVLSDLSHARDVVRQSRILQVQFEPPQSISALLIQEAVRRAPKPREEMNWFQRFMRSVLMHPAMAAAAMLVLIIGVAGTMYLKKGDHFARDTKAPELAATNSASEQPAATPPLAEPTAAITADAGATEQFGVGLQEGADGAGAQTAEVRAQTITQQKELDDAKVAASADRQRAEVEKKKRELQVATEMKSNLDADKNAADETLAKKEVAASRKEPPSQPAKAAEQPKAGGEAVAKTAPKAKPEPKSKGYIEVTTPDQRPKDFESNKVAGRGDSPKQAPAVASNRPGVAGPSPTTGAAPPAPPPPAEAEKPADAKPDPMLAWAKEQHGKAIAAAKKDCKLAASIATQIANRAPAYYAANIENDRALKSCQQYIAAEREKELERANRAKATQRRAVDEAPAPAATKK